MVDFRLKMQYNDIASKRNGVTPIAKLNISNYTYSSPVGLPFAFAGALVNWWPAGFFYCLKESASIMNRNTLITQVDSWVRVAAVVASYARGSSKEEFMTPAQMSESLQLRWFMSHCRVKAQIEHNRERIKGGYWLGSFNLGGLDPYLLVFRRNDTLTETDMEAAESVILTTFPNIKLTHCHFCEGRIVSEQREGEFFCAACLRLIPLKNSQGFGYVYIFGSIEEGRYKIGQSVRPDSRLSDYRASKLPFPVQMIHTIPADDKARAEADLHEEYRGQRTNGEWFKLSPVELDRITSLKGYKAGRWIR